MLVFVVCLCLIMQRCVVCFLEGVEAFVMRLLFVQVNMARARWFDMPFTREESLTADKKVNLFSE